MITANSTGANIVTNTTWKKERQLESLTGAKSASGQSVKPLSIRQIEWRLHTYFEELHRRRAMGIIKSSHGRHVTDGGATGGEFKSKSPGGMEYTDIDALAAYAWIDGKLALLKKHNRDWFLAVWLAYELMADKSLRPPKRCIEIAGVSSSTYYDYLSRAKRWLITKHTTCSRVV